MIDPKHIADPNPIRPKEDRKLGKTELRHLKLAQEAV